MPKNKSKLHLNMLKDNKDGNLYGIQWGDPDSNPNLSVVRDFFLRKFIGDTSKVVEIGPGGGRWTRYMLDAEKIYVVDCFEEILEEHGKNIESEKVVRIKNNGMDFPGVPKGEINFVFSFGVFVHLEMETIRAYLKNIKPILAKDALVFIHYSDKTKKKAMFNRTFTVNYPDRMRKAVLESGYSVVFENTTLLPHSSCICFCLNEDIKRQYPSGRIPVLEDHLYDVSD